MTGFPIAVGTGPRHSSSRPFPQDGHVIMTMGMNDDETLTATVFISYNFHPIKNSTDDEPDENDAGGSDEETNDTTAAAAGAAHLSSASFDDNHHFNVIAELRVQISHAASPLVSNTDAMSNRETKSRVPLGIMKKKRRRIPQQFFTPAASVVFSSSQSHLACLTPFPPGYELVSAASHGTNYSSSSSSSQISTIESVSTVVIFNIQTYTISSRQQIRQQNRILSKLPDYILEQTKNDDANNGGNSKALQSDGDHDSIRSEHQSNNSKSQSIYVAHVPKIVRVAQEDVSSDSDVHLPSLQSAACICNVPSDSKNGKGPDAFSTLLVGTTDGSLLIIDFETARVKDILYDDKQTDRSTYPIIHLSQCPPTHWKPHNKYGDELGSHSKGRISAVTQDGGISIFSTTFHGANQQQTSSSIYQSRNFVNKSGLIMEIEPLAQFHPSYSNNSSNIISGLRYVCTKWLNPLLLAVLTRSPFLDEDFSIQKSSTLPEIVVAQVWSVTEVQVADNPEQALSNPNVCVISELKFPCENSLIELAHGTFSLSQESEFEATFGKSYTITYNSYRDCLALSSQLVSLDQNTKEVTKVKVRPFCITWDWKRNAQGLTLISDTALSSRRGHSQLNAASMPSIFSQFLVSNDCAIHFYEKAYAQRKRLHKDIYNLSTLSPSSVSHRGSNVRLCEVSALMLRGDVITYPLLTQPLATSDVSLQWEESRIPSSYVAANGPCRIAAIGKDKGHSIAVAASRGLCVLDLSRTSWHASDSQQRNEIMTPCVKSDSGIGASASHQLPLCPQWKLFSNMNDEQQFRVVSFLWWESSADDFILAVVQYMTSDVPHLVCWSHRRLGFGESQLLIEQNEYIAKRKDDTKPFSSHGLTLPNGFRVDSMSIIKDPAGSDRALLLLSSISSDEKSSGIDYALYHLQTTKQSPTSERVLAKLSAHGDVPLTVGSAPGIFPTDSITGVFLAGGSFLYDLDANQLDSQHGIFGVIGITSLFLDLCVACVDHTGPILYKPSLLERHNSIGTKKSIVASYWISDLTCRGRIVWNIAMNDGKVYCWAAPCYSSSSSTQSQMTAQTSPEKHALIGEICYLGRSSLWQNGSTLNGSEVALGPFLSTHFSCTMYSGQSSRTIRPKSGIDIKAIPSFHAGNCVVTAPSYTPSLYLSFLNLAKQDPTSCKSEPNIIDSIEKSYIRMTLLKAKNNGSSRSALRIIILKVVELLDETNGNRERLEKWKEGMSILREVVSVAREVFDELSVASFFLSVGRQLEPHQFDLIFPLPVEGGAGISAEDLFMVAVEKGSISVALSGLSLFSCHQKTQKRVVQLLCHCLYKIDEIFALSAAFSSEEAKYLHQLYWFGVKLEDAIIAENSNMFDTIDSGESAIMSNSSTSFDESSIGYASNGDYSVESSEDSSRASFEENQDVSFISCRSQNRKPREGLVTKVVSRLFQSSRPPKNNSFEEDAIYEAATSFIISGFDYEKEAEALTSTEANGICNDEANHGGNDTFDTLLLSVAGSTCTFLSHVIGFNCKPASKARGWKVASAIAYLIQGDRETLAISNAAASNAVRISQLVTTDELIDIYTFDHRINSESASQQVHSKVASFLEHLTSHCRDQIHSDAVESILNLVLLLLLRHDTCEDVQLHRGHLILIGIVCGHLSGRITDLIDLSQECCDVHLIYQLFTQQ